MDTARAAERRREEDAVLAARVGRTVPVLGLDRFRRALNERRPDLLRIPLQQGHDDPEVPRAQARPTAWAATHSARSGDGGLPAEGPFEPVGRTGHEDGRFGSIEGAGHEAGLHRPIAGAEHEDEPSKPLEGTEHEERSPPFAAGGTHEERLSTSTRPELVDEPKPAADEPAEAVGLAPSADSSGDLDDWTEGTFGLIQHVCDSSHSFEHWSTTLQLDETVLPETELRLSLSPQWLSLRFITQSPQAVALLSKHVDRLRRQLEAAPGLPSGIGIETP